MTSQLTTTLIGTAGEYYVCAELCKRGFLALPTPKSNPLFDIVVTDTEGRKSVSIQVKTRSIKNKQGWKVGVDLAKGLVNPDMFVILVNLEDAKPPQYYIYEGPVIAERVTSIYQAYISKPKRDGSAKKEVGFRWFDEKSFNEDDRSRKNNWQPILDALR